MHTVRSNRKLSIGTYNSEIPIVYISLTCSYPAGSVVLVLLNLHTFDTNATLSNNELASSTRDRYWLTPPGNTTDVESR